MYFVEQRHSTRAQWNRERCREEEVQAGEVAKENAAQVVVQGTTLLHLWQIYLVKALAVRTGVTRCLATHPAASFPPFKHLRPHYRRPLLEVLVQKALESAFRSGAVTVGTTLLSRPG